MAGVHALPLRGGRLAIAIAVALLGRVDNQARRTMIEANCQNAM